MSHVLPADKGTWLAEHMNHLGVHASEAAAVGDSTGDLDMFAVVGSSVYVGERLPTGCDAHHLPGGDLTDAVDLLLSG